MRNRLITLSFILNLLAGGTLAGSFDEAILRNNLADIVSEGEALDLFTTPQLSYLQDLKKTDTQISAIDQFLGTQALLEITISEEAKISVNRTSRATPDAVCGKYSPWIVRIVNQGFLTAPLNVNPGDRFSEGLLEIKPIMPKLTGASIEYRILNLRTVAKNAVEISLRFDAGLWTHDLGSRSKVSLLIPCKNSASG